MVNVLVGTNLAKLNTNADFLFISKNEGRRLLELKFTGWCSSARLWSSVGAIFKYQRGCGAVLVQYLNISITKVIDISIIRG